MRERLASVFKSKTRDQWCEVMQGSDACFAPVLTLGEAPLHPHNRARDTFIDIEGVTQPAPAPRFSRSKTSIPHAPPIIGANADQALGEWGFDPQEIAALRQAGALP
jgi:alpha-methylacyl-CoA racemase